MNPSEKNLEEEYLQKTVGFLRRELESVIEEALQHRQDLIEARRDMWENTNHSTQDFDKLTEIVQFLSEVNSQTVGYSNRAKYVQRYQKLIKSPYFGRFDFKEDGYGNKEQIYIGRASVMDPKTHDVYVYDWRAPISSIFYRYELGRATYQTPDGMSSGDVLLKRQYKIQRGKLKYFFDCSIRITDEILQEILGSNLTPKMRSIVESIQKEQDIIIRDTDHELLMVQGTAGSGKTSIALHRIAYLLYDSLNDGHHLNLRSSNVMIISPNDVFSQYISGVLPELGEDNVTQTTFDDIVSSYLSPRFSLIKKQDYLEEYIQSYPSERGEHLRKSAAFKGSFGFQKILDRWIWYYGHRLLPFEDTYFDGKILENRHQIRGRYLNNEIGIPMLKQLQRIENILMLQSHPYKKNRLEKITNIVAKSEGRDLEIKSFSRLLAIKESEALRKRIQRFTKVDYWEMYCKLFSNPKYFFALAKGVELPYEIEEIIKSSYPYLINGELRYEDYSPLLYLKLKIEGEDPFSEIRHIVIDEAQDYSPLQYAVFKLLFRNAHCTVLGDIEQTIDKQRNEILYDEVEKIFARAKSAKLMMNKSYRSTVEINRFAQRLIDKTQDILPFARNGELPRIKQSDSRDMMEEQILQDVRNYLDKGYGSIAIICKTQREAVLLHSRLKNTFPVTLVQPEDKDYRKGALVLSSYMAKGLEFDVVLVYGVDQDHFQSELDRKLLYIACSRALHVLNLYYTGVISPFIS